MIVNNIIMKQQIPTALHSTQYTDALKMLQFHFTTEALIETHAELIIRFKLESNKYMYII